MGDTYQSGHRVGGTVTGSLPHRGHLLAGELAGLHVRPQHRRQQARLVVQLGGQRPLVPSVLGALLHRGQDAGLFALRHPTESDGCIVVGDNSLQDALQYW